MAKFVRYPPEMIFCIGPADLHVCRIKALAAARQPSLTRWPFISALAQHRKHQRNIAIVRHARHRAEHDHDYESQYWIDGRFEQY
jgi:hypothetical protein